jgi:hypothetical protein
VSLSGNEAEVKDQDYRILTEPTPLNGKYHPRNPSPIPGLCAEDYEELQSRGLDDETILRSHIYSLVDATAIYDLLHGRVSYKALDIEGLCQWGTVMGIPYFDQDIKPTGYVVYRPNRRMLYSAARNKDHFKGPKYICPKGVPNQAYITPQCAHRLRAKQNAVDIAEGCFKTLVLLQNGYTAIGINGCWGWCVKGQKDVEGIKTLIPSLAAIDWTGRTVRINADYDPKPKTRQRVIGAAKALAKALYRAGAANVYLVMAPGTEDGPKIGVDDYIKEHGHDAYLDLLKKAQRLAGLSYRITNYRTEEAKDKDDGKGEGKLVKRALTAPQIIARIDRTMGGWPRRVGGVLWAPDGDQVRRFDDPAALFAWMQLKQPEPIRWGQSASSGMVAKAELFAALQQTVSSYDAVELYPHFPKLPNRYYLHPDPIHGGKYLSGLVDYFRPASDVDRELLKAAIITQLWSGAGGQRPAFIILASAGDADGGRGRGKTTVPRLVGRLVGGCLSDSLKNEFKGIITDLLSPGADGFRVGLLDNVKALELSNDQFEALITSEYIDGHAMFEGKGRRLNTFSWFVTINGANLSKDIAKRGFIIELGRCEYTPEWQKGAERYIDEYRWHLIGEIGDILAAPSVKLSAYSRWAAWEDAVLSHVDSPDQCWNVVQERQQRFDSDQDEADGIREAFVKAIRDVGMYPDVAVVRFSTESTAEIVNTVKKPPETTLSVTKYLHTQNIPELRKGGRNGSGWLWRGSKASVNQVTRDYDQVVGQADTFMARLSKCIESRVSREKGET